MEGGRGEGRTSKVPPLRPLDRVLGEDPRSGVEVGDEFDDDRALGDLEGRVEGGAELEDGYEASWVDLGEVVGGLRVEVDLQGVGGGLGWREGGKGEEDGRFRACRGLRSPRGARRRGGPSRRWGRCRERDRGRSC